MSLGEELLGVYAFLYTQTLFDSTANRMPLLLRVRRFFLLVATAVVLHKQTPHVVTQ
jgi:hypothetical protein